MKNGTELWITCNDSYIIVIDTRQWSVVKSVSPEKINIKTFFALPATHLTNKSTQKYPLSSLCVGLPTNSDGLVFLSGKTTESTINLNKATPWKCNSFIKRLSISPNANWIALIGMDGSLKLYSLEMLLQQAFQKLPPQPTSLDRDCVRLNKNLDAFDKKVRSRNITEFREPFIPFPCPLFYCLFTNNFHFKVTKYLSRQRLLAILSEYGEYPAQYRQIIWKNLLKLPNTTTAYCKRSLHNSLYFTDLF